MDFDRFAETYESEIETATRFAKLPPDFSLEVKVDHMLRTLRQAFGDLSRVRVLDAGCGVGLTDQRLKPHLPCLAGVDVSAKSLEVARAKNPGVAYHHAPDGTLPFAKASFDVVFTICVWHHVPPGNWTRFLSELSRVIAQGGLLLVYEHNPWNPLTRLVVSRCSLDKDAVLLSARQAARRVGQFGFEKIVTEYPNVPAISKSHHSALGIRDPSQNSLGGTIRAARHTAMTSGAARGVSVVVPTYGNAPGLEPLAIEIANTLQRENRVFEILFVNDGSPDATWDAIQRINGSHPEVRGINLMRNYGQHNALLAGIFNARQEVIVTLDDDFQTPPTEIPKLLNRLDEGFDLVYGARDKEQHGPIRNLASRLMKWALQHTMRARLARSITSFRAFRTDLMRDYPHSGPPAVFIDALLDWTAQRVTSVPVEHRPRETGKSQYSWSRLTRHAVNMVTSLSVVPLQLAVLLGFLTTFFGLCLFVFVLASYFLQGTKVPGFNFLAVIILLFSGVQLCVLGIIGEYLSRIYLRLLGKPAFVIKETL